MKYSFKLSALVLLAALASCQSKQVKEEANDPAPVKMVELTKDQFNMAKMEIGEPLEHTFLEQIDSKGYLKPSPDGIAQVGVPIPGRVKQILHKTGEWVNKDEVLFKLKGTKIIELQQEYVQTHAKLTLASSEKERLAKLVEANVAAKKDYQMAVSDYQVLKATNDALTTKLHMLNLNPEEIVNGNIVSEISIKAPISGYITSTDLMVGELLEPQSNAIEIINNHKLQLSFYVFENALSQMKEGQQVKFFEPDRKQEVYTGRVEVIGKSIDEETKTVPCVATIDNIKELNLVNGMYAECTVIVNERLAKAVPTEAIVKDGYRNYVLVKAGENDGVHQFTKVPVDIGRQELEFTEILTDGLSNVLLKGLYNLNLD